MVQDFWTSPKLCGTGFLNTSIELIWPSEKQFLIPHTSQGIPTRNMSRSCCDTELIWTITYLLLDHLMTPISQRLKRYTWRRGFRFRILLIKSINLCGARGCCPLNHGSRAVTPFINQYVHVTQDLNSPPFCNCP